MKLLRDFHCQRPTTNIDPDIVASVRLSANFAYFALLLSPCKRPTVEVKHDVAFAANTALPPFVTSTVPTKIAVGPPLGILFGPFPRL